MSPPWTLRFSDRAESFLERAWERAGKLRPYGVAVKQTTIWSFKLGAWLRERLDDYRTRDERAWKVEMAKGHAYMRDHFWPEFNRRTADAGEKAFDAIVGDQASHGVLPLFRPGVFDEWLRLTGGISDRRLTRLVEINEAEKALADLHTATAITPYDRNLTFEENRRRVIERDQQALERFKAKADQEFLADLEKVIRLQTDPNNWDLTPEQVALLPEAWRNRLDAINRLEDYAAWRNGGGGAPPDSIRDEPDWLWSDRPAIDASLEAQALREEMAAEAWDRYEFGPLAPPGEHGAAGGAPATHGPEPRPDKR